MQAVFHWLRVQVFCYPTENEQLIKNTFTNIVGDAETVTDIFDGEFGDNMEVIRTEIVKQRGMDTVFRNLGKNTVDSMLENLESRVDDDRVLYIRLDKQEAVQDCYKIVHHSDVVSITGKIVAHPAKKDIAVNNLRNYLEGLFQNSSSPSISDGE